MYIELIIYVSPIRSHNDYSINRYVNIEYRVCKCDMSLRSYGHLNWRKRNRLMDSLRLIYFFHTFIPFLAFSMYFSLVECSILQKKDWEKRWKIQSKWIELFPLNMKTKKKKKTALKKSAHAIAIHSVKITCEQKHAIYHSGGSTWLALLSSVAMLGAKRKAANRTQSFLLHAINIEWKRSLFIICRGIAIHNCFATLRNFCIVHRNISQLVARRWFLMDSECWDFLPSLTSSMLRIKFNRVHNIHTMNFRARAVRFRQIHKISRCAHYLNSAY